MLGKEAGGLSLVWCLEEKVGKRTDAGVEIRRELNDSQGWLVSILGLVQGLLMS